MRSIWRNAAALAAALLFLLVATPAQAQDAAALRARHEGLQAALADSPFRRPLLIHSDASSQQLAAGDVHAVIDHPYRVLAAALRQPRHWCELLLLQSNIKRCRQADSGPEPQLELAIGRKFDQPAEDAYRLALRFAVPAARADYLRVQMDADHGPLGTRDYKLTLEAVPLDARRSYVHMSYSYASGPLASLAVNAYLATTGRHKVGFSVVGRDEQGQPIHVSGMRGVAERNAMRYFLAIEAALAALSLPAEQRLERRLNDWFAATERYPRQLHEMEREDYLALKRKEARQPVAAAS
ncbi:MAG TPA: hypothetical protein VJN44_20975 [Roseateles sp.]|nr:hypothetical protein [Roseateles sp.]